MAIAPTLRCACGERFLEQASAYEAPPNGETLFNLGSAPYRRAYDSCRVCGHWFSRHDLELSGLYEQEYVDATYGSADGMRAKFAQIMGLPPQRSDNRGRVARLLSFARERGFDVTTRPRVLDVGAGLGVFPAAMVEAGWEAVALERDRRAVEHLCRVVGIEAWPLDLLAVDPCRDGRFDAVTFNKVLEHVEDPLPLVDAARRLLSDRGFIYVEVPDVAAAEAGHGREEFFIEHHHVFSPASLTMLAERAGLSLAALERLREPSGKFTLRIFMVRATACSG